MAKIEIWIKLGLYDCREMTPWNEELLRYLPSIHIYSIYAHVDSKIFHFNYAIYTNNMSSFNA